MRGTSENNTDHFGITAEHVGEARLIGWVLPLTAGKDDFNLNGIGDVRLVEV